MRVICLLILIIVLCASATAQGQDLDYLDRCYTAGQSYAGAYLLNIDKAADVGALASDFMIKACKTQGNANVVENACGVFKTRSDTG